MLGRGESNVFASARVTRETSCCLCSATTYKPCLVELSNQNCRRSDARQFAVSTVTTLGKLLSEWSYGSLSH